MKSFAKAGPKAIVLVSRNEAGLKEVQDEIKEIDKDVQVEIIPTDIKSDMRLFRAMLIQPRKQM